MCFKKPKAPAKSAEDLRAEKELEEMRKIRQAQLNRELTESKESRLQEAIARASGFVGRRSLLKGGRGGSGFMGRNTRNATPLIPGSGRSGGGSIRPSAPAIAGGGSSSSASLFSYAGGGSRSAGGARQAY